MAETLLHPNYSLTKSREARFFNDDDYVNPLPRAVMRPKSAILLDGEWNFEHDKRNLGIIENWYISHNYDAKANWPGSVETHLSNLNNPEKLWHDKIIVWYEREFPLPEIPEADKSSSLLQLTFGACGYETQVWLNGTPLKTIEGEEVHVGEYTSFSYELDDRILRQTNKITIRIVATMDADTTRGKQESSVYKRGGIWYQTYSGGVRSIWIENVAKNRLRSRIGVVSDVEDHLVRFNMTTRIQNPGKYKIQLNVYNRKQVDFIPIATDEYELLLEAGQKQQRLVIEIPKSIPWTPEHPHLYRLIAKLIDEDGRCSEIEAHFGLRKIETIGSAIYLNNKKIYLNGILYQPGIASYEQIKMHMHAMKKLGCNLVRIHIAGVDPRIYNLADKLGLLLWVEVPSPHHSTVKSRANHKAELLRMLALIGTHVSVIIWSLYNEDWGAQDIATNAKTRQYIMEMYHYMQIAHPQFLVVDNDGWQHISYEGRLKTSLLSAHLYTPDLEKWQEVLDNFTAGKLNGVAAFPLVVGDPFFFRKQVPLIVSEWGGFGFAEYGGPENGTERTLKIELFKKELRKRNIAGDVYTQATNIEDEVNGLIDFNTADLKVPEGLLGGH